MKHQKKIDYKISNQLKWKNGQEKIKLKPKKYLVH